MSTCLASLVIFIGAIVMVRLAVEHLWIVLTDTLADTVENEYSSISSEEPLFYTYEVINRFPHDRTAHLGGFQFERHCSVEKCRNVFLESTSNLDESTLRRSEVETGRIIDIIRLRGRYFGKGMTKHGTFIYQRADFVPSVYVYDRNFSLVHQLVMEDLSVLSAMTTDQKYLIMRDYMGRLQWIHPDTFVPHKIKEVKDGQRDLYLITETQWINGKIWATLYDKDCIAIIDPRDGKVHGWLPLTGLRERAAKEADTNPIFMQISSIAHDADRDRIFLTGSWWPFVYEIRLKSGKCPESWRLQLIRQTCLD